MFALVDDVPRYPEFLPWCSDSEVLNRDAAHVLARLEVHKGAFRKSFTTTNRMEPYTGIYMVLEEGPFSSFEGNWTFEELREDACKVELDLQFDFSNPLISMMLSPLFENIGNTLVDAFTKRAEAVYA
jgi:ribosome-associated toxin RatA of RatAB toxin-antitoxin module